MVAKNGLVDSWLFVTTKTENVTKASVLVYNIGMNSSNLSSPLLQEEKRLRTEITRLSLKAMQLTTATERTAVNAEIRNNEISLGRLQEKLNAKNPSALTIPTVAALQKDLLDQNTALYSFHLTDSVLTVFRITTSDFTVEQKAFGAGFRNDIAALVNNLATANAQPGDDVLYTRLRSYLLKPNEEKERLVFVPENELADLPFEVLKDEEGRFLAENHSVQYQYATALLKKETAGFGSASTLAFAPFAASAVKNGRLVFSQLPFSASEFGADHTTAFIDSAATKEAFLTNLKRPDILHFATHAAVNRSDNGLSYIAFWPQAGQRESEYLLYEKEIADLSLPRTRLVILSACESGAGNLVRGEGIMSLSRAFAYAGCPNTITSLWKANDMSTAFLVQHIHNNLAKGWSIDKALQEAKRAYLADQTINPRMKAPSYWAHLVFIGNYAPQKQSASSWVQIIAGLVLASAFTWQFAKKAKRKAAHRE